MENRLFEQVRNYEDYIAGCITQDSGDVDNLITLGSAYACAYLAFFEEVKTDASDSMMLLKIYTNTMKKIERAIIEAGIKHKIRFTFNHDGSEILVEEWKHGE